MNIQTKIVVLFIHLSGMTSLAQTNSIIPGIWKGTSICQVKTSPCHDETVVYHILKTGNAQVYEVTMNKIVNNAKEEMGMMKFMYDPSKETLISRDTIRDATWTFVLKGKKIDGTLIYKKQLYRIINVVKD
jgi:Zn/Cd-binding protein ZinT